MHAVSVDVSALLISSTAGSPDFGRRGWNLRNEDSFKLVETQSFILLNYARFCFPVQYLHSSTKYQLNDVVFLIFALINVCMLKHSVVTNTSTTVFKYFSKYCSLRQYLNTI